MKLEGRRSSRNLPASLSSGTVVSAPANGDCFFHLVAIGIEKVLQTESSNHLEALHQPKRKKIDTKNLNDDSISDSVAVLREETTHELSEFSTVTSLRNLVADKYSEETFELMVVAGQIPCTSRTVPTFDEFKAKLRNDRAFADEHCIGIISSHFNIAFLILDDNIGGKPTCYWNGNKENLQNSEGETSQITQPKYFMTLRLGRQHYSGIQFGNKLLHDSKQLHPQISNFWENEIRNI